MPFSSGTYSLPGPALNPGDTVSSVENNQFRNDVASALNKTFLRDGTATATANFPMGGFKNTGLAAGTTSGDSVRFDEFAVLDSAAVKLTGDQTIAGTKTFSSAIAASVTGNAATVTNGVYTSGDQTIAGTKTFSSPIDGNITGNAATATTATTANAIADGAVSTSAKIVNGIVTPAKLSQPLTLGAAVNTTSGTAIDFTSIPSWVKRITVMFNGVSTSGSNNCQIQLGSGSITVTGYSSFGGAYTSGSATNTAFSTTGLLFEASGAAASARNGIATITNVSGNIWVMSAAATNSSGTITQGGGVITLGGVLDRIRLTTVGGTDTFDAGSVNIMYE